MPFQIKLKVDPIYLYSKDNWLYSLYYNIKYLCIKNPLLNIISYFNTIPNYLFVNPTDIDTIIDIGIANDIYDAIYITFEYLVNHNYITIYNHNHLYDHDYYNRCYYNNGKYIDEDTYLRLKYIKYLSEQANSLDDIDDICINFGYSYGAWSLIYEFTE